MCNVKFFFNFFWCVCIFVSFRNRGRKKSRYLRGKPIREQPRQTLFSKRRNLVEITRFIFAKKQWGKRKKKLRMVLIWRVKSALILSLLFYLIDYLKCHFSLSVMSDRQVYRCFFFFIFNYELWLARLDWHWLRTSQEKIANRLQKICKCSYKCSYQWNFLLFQFSQFLTPSVLASVFYIQHGRKKSWIAVPLLLC